MFFTPPSSNSRLPIQSSLCLGTHIATHTHTQAHKVLLWLVGNMPPANYPATENDLNTEKCVQFFALGFFGRYKEEYLLTRPASKVLMPMGEAGGKSEVGRRWTTICKQLLSSLKAKFSSFIYFRFLIIISSSFFFCCRFAFCFMSVHVSLSATFSCAF